MKKFFEDENSKRNSNRYLIIPKNNKLKILFNNKRYLIRIIKHQGMFYWKLTPYKNSYFKTKININNQNIDMLLLAISEDSN